MLIFRLAYGLWTMCGGWACASYSIACNNPPLSTIRFTGREFIPTPCGPWDKCWVQDTSCSRGTCLVPHKVEVEMQPCLDLNSNKPKTTESEEKAKENWKNAYEKVKKEGAQDETTKN